MEKPFCGINNINKDYVSGQIKKAQTLMGKDAAGKAKTTVTVNEAMSIFEKQDYNVNKSRLEEYARADGEKDLSTREMAAFMTSMDGKLEKDPATGLENFKFDGHIEKKTAPKKEEKAEEKAQKEEYERLSKKLIEKRGESAEKFRSCSKTTEDVLQCFDKTSAIDDEIKSLNESLKKVDPYSEEKIKQREEEEQKEKALKDSRDLKYTLQNQGPQNEHATLLKKFGLTKPYDKIQQSEKEAATYYASKRDWGRQDGILLGCRTIEGKRGHAATGGPYEGVCSEDSAFKSE